MKKKLLFRIAVYTITAALVFQAGAAVYALVESYTASISEAEQPKVEEEAAEPITFKTVSVNQSPEELAKPEGQALTDEINITMEVLGKIKASSPSNYEHYVALYKQLLVKFKVDQPLQAAIEQLILADHPIMDVLTAYEFVYRNFGTVNDFNSLVQQKKTGKAWGRIFDDYHRQHPVFVPRSYDPDYMEQLMSVSKLTADDIMIADHLSFVTGEPFEDVISSRLKEQSWKAVASSYKVLFRDEKLPRVQISGQQMNKYTASGKRTEQQVAEAFVIANALDSDVEDILTKIDKRMSTNDIYAEGYQKKYY